MVQVNDLSRSLAVFDQVSTLVVVVEMSKASWLVSGVVPGVERQPLKKLEPDATALLRLIERWRALVSNKGFRRFVKTIGSGNFSIDYDKVEADAKFDGLFVLRTNTKLSALQVVLRYRNLLAVEDTFKTTKALLTTRPIFHKTDAAIHGHIFCSFLAVLLRKELFDRLAARRHSNLEWQHIVDDLDELSEIEVEQDGRRALLRTAPGATIDPLCRALGITLPPVFQEIPPAPE